METNKGFEQDKIIKLLLRIGANLQREGTKILAPCGLNPQQFVVLKEIEEKNPLNQKQICSQLLFEKSNVSKIVKKLLTYNLIKKVGFKKDKRVTLLTVTSKGQKIIDEYMDKLNGWNKSWLEPFNQKELLNTIKVLEQLNTL